MVVHYEEGFNYAKNKKNTGIVFDTAPDFSLETLKARQLQVRKNDIHDVFHHIWEGGMPQVIDEDEELRMEYYNSYVDTYLMRDVAEEGGITDSIKFTKFLRACAALVAEQVNYATLAESSDISEPTAKEIDVFVEENKIIHPLEIKKSANPNSREVRKFTFLDKTTLRRGNGGIVCMCEEPIPIDNQNFIFRAI